jgi:hypothetical protein
MEIFFKYLMGHGADPVTSQRCLDAVLAPLRPGGQIRTRRLPWTVNMEALQAVHTAAVGRLWTEAPVLV